MMHSGRDPQAEGGADVASFIQVMALYGISGSFEGTPSLEENKTMIGVKARDENNNVIENNLHFLIPEAVEKDENGKVINIICRDPTKGVNGVKYSLEDVVGYLNLSELPVYAGSDGSFGSGSGSSWSA